MVKLNEKETFCKQRVSTRHLKTLVDAFVKHERKECVQAELHTLGMTKTEFQLHFKHRERFEKGAEDYETYASMVKSLEDESLAKLRGHCVAACRLHKTTAPKKIKKAALKLKQKIPWVPDTFKASPT